MPHKCRGEINDLSGNFSAVYFREEPCYDSHNENKKNRRGKRSCRASCSSPKASFRKHKKFVPFDEVFMPMLIDLIVSRFPSAEGIRYGALFVG